MKQRKNCKRHCISVGPKCLVTTVVSPVARVVGLIRTKIGILKHLAFMVTLF